MKPLPHLAKATLPLINAVVTRLDEEAWRFLTPHENKIICFDIVDVAVFYFQIKPTGLEVIDISDDTFIDTTFKGPLTSFVSMVFSKRVSHPDLHVRGDLECAKSLYDTWHYLECDWEGALAKWTHPTFAHGLVSTLKEGKRWFKETAENRANDLTAYLQDESQILPSKNEMEDYFSDIEKLRDDVERFEVKLSNVMKKLTS